MLLQRLNGKSADENSKCGGDLGVFHKIVARATLATHYCAKNVILRGFVVCLCSFVSGCGPVWSSFLPGLVKGAFAQKFSTNLAAVPASGFAEFWPVAVHYFRMTI